MIHANLLLIPLLLALNRASAQDAPQTSQIPYPQWVTNDYNCVIKCIDDQLGSAQPPATDDQKNAALGCVRDACSKDTAAGNDYQAHYIINMFDTIGSIYEPQSWQDGNAPNAVNLAAPSGWVEGPVTTTWTDSNGQAQTATTTAWVPPASSAGSSSDSGDSTDSAVADDAAQSASGPIASSPVQTITPTGGANAAASGSGNATATGTGLSGALGVAGVDMALTAWMGAVGMLAMGALGGVRPLL